MSELNLKSISQLPVADSVADTDHILVEMGGVGKRLPVGNFTSHYNIFEVAWTESYSPYVVDGNGNTIADPVVLREAMLSGPLFFKTLAAIGMQIPDIPGYMYMHATYILDYNTGIRISFQVGGEEVLVTVGDSL